MGIFKPSGACVPRERKHPTIGGISREVKTYIGWEGLTPKEKQRAVIKRSVALATGAVITASLASGIGRPAKNLSQQDVAASTQQASRQAMSGIKDGRERLLAQFFKPIKVPVKTQEEGNGFLGYVTDYSRFVTLGQTCLRDSQYEFTYSASGQLPPANIDDLTPGSLNVIPAGSQMAQSAVVPGLSFLVDERTGGWVPADPQTTQELVDAGCQLVPNGSFAVSN